MSSVGRNTITGIGEQTEKGVAADSFTKLRATNNNLEGTVNIGTSEALTGNRFADDQFVTAHVVGGSIGAELEKLTFATIIKHAIGGEIGTPQEIETTGLYKHIFKPTQDLEGWLSILKYFKDGEYYDLFSDCRINQLSFNVTSQAVISYTIDVLGITDASDAGEPTETIVDNDADKLFAWDTHVNWGSDITSIMDEFSFTHNNNIDGDDYGFKQDRRSLDAQDGEHTFNLTTQFDASEYASMKSTLKNGNVITNFAIEIGETTEEGIPYIKIPYPKVKLTQVGAPISGPGRITTDIQGIALWDSTDEANVVIEIVDDNSEKY